MLLSGIPRVRLLDGPTPLQRLERIEALTGHGALWVKRDDAMPLGQGGNKLRSLEFWLGEARAQGADIVLAAGQTVSNQCRLTAAAAARLGLECLILHNDDSPAVVQGNHLLARLYGARFRFLGPIDEDARGARVAEAAAELRSAGRRPYVVGDAAVGALGYVAAALELHQQADAMGVDLRHVVLPGSMGPTEAGFLYGLARLGAPVTVHLVSIEYGLDEMDARIDAVFRAVAGRLGAVGDWRPWTRRYDGYLGPGYAVPTAAAYDAIATFASREALLLETTYTAKTFAGALDLVRRSVIPPGEAACLLHTGGVPALYGQADAVARALPCETA